MTYRELKARHQKAVNEFIKQHAFFAYDQEQHAEGVRKLGTDDVVQIMAGGYVRSDQRDALVDMLQEQHAELIEAMRKEPAFAVEAFRVELNNTEFSYTGDESDALELLGLTPEDIDAEAVLSDALEQAMQEAAGKIQFGEVELQVERPDDVKIEGEPGPGKVRAIKIETP